MNDGFVGRFEHAGSTRLPDEKGTIAIEVGLNSLFARIPVWLLNGAGLCQLLLGQDARPNGAIPGYGPLADVVLQRG